LTLNFFSTLEMEAILLNDPKTQQPLPKIDL
jgi:hypothetical protein